MISESIEVPYEDKKPVQRRTGRKEKRIYGKADEHSDMERKI